MGLNVFLIDKDEDDRRFMRSALTRGWDSTFVFHQASNAAEGLELMHRTDLRPAVALVEFGLPDRSALEVLADLRDAEGYVPIPLLVVAENQQEIDSATVTAAGAQDVVSKERLTQFELAAAVRGAVARHELVRRQRETEGRFRLLVDGTPDYAMILLDADNQIIHWNPGAERVFGYSEAEAFGQSGELIFTGDDRANGVPRQELEKAIHLGRAEDERLHVRKDGSTLWVSGVVTPLRDEETGTLTGFAKIARDITERKKISAELLEAKTRAEKLLHLVRDEVRKPLAEIIDGTARLTERLTGEDRQLATKTRQSARRLLYVLSGLLSTEEMEAGSTELNLEPVVVGQATESVVALFLAPAQEKGLRLSLMIPEEASHACARLDRSVFASILYNLLSNAIEHTHEGSVALTVMLQDGEVAVYVEDTGEGIDATVLPEVFSGPGTTGGRESGLDLVVVKRLAELMDGRVSVESEKGVGSRFMVAFPHCEAPAEELPVMQAATSGLPKVLVMAADPALREEVLEQMGDTHALTLVDRVEDALASAEEIPFDLVLIALDRGDQHELVQRLRRKVAYQTTPIVALVGEVTGVDRGGILEQGFTGVHSGPFSATGLREFAPAATRA